MSWPKALQKALWILEGSHPEIAEARRKDEKREKSRTRVDDACDLWLAEQKRLHPREKSGTYDRYCSIANRIKNWANAHKRINCIGDITTADLRAWYGSKEWTDQKANTRANDWKMIRMVFKWLLEDGVLEENPILKIKPGKPAHGEQGPYTPAQLSTIFTHAAICRIPDNVGPEEKLVYRERLTTFITTLLRVGCDVVDAVLFQPGKIKDESTSDGASQPVYEYKRKRKRKTTGQ
jgi:site-specific recombinase XerD